MPQGTDIAELVRLKPDERLLGEDLDKLPAAVGHPEAVPPSPARRRVVAIGATLTGVTLILGTVLALFGAIDGIATGFDTGSVLALIVGIVLVATHWGWVHVAEITGQRLERRGSREVLDRRQSWLAAIEPYTRWDVATHTDDDGSIAIVTTRYRPVASHERTFTFVKETVAEERHSGDEQAAVVAERAELLRRQAAAETALERDRYEAAHDAHEGALLEHADEQERLDAVRAASRALSDQINTNLRNPPLAE
jgi:hypothetical protein